MAKQNAKHSKDQGRDVQGDPMNRDFSRQAIEGVKDTPHKGETYRCSRCGMELEITAECGCDDPSHVHLECCGQELAKV